MGKPVIHHGTVDSKGYYIDKYIIGRLFMYTGNNKLYKINRFVWHGDDDTWHVEFSQFKADYPMVEDRSDVVYTRSYTNFFGESDGKPRFIKVER